MILASEHFTIPGADDQLAQLNGNPGDLVLVQGERLGVRIGVEPIGTELG